MSKETVKAYKENEMFELIQEAVDDLHRIADRLERYANSQGLSDSTKQQGEADA